MKFCSIVSGSSGNCLYVENDGTRILIDCGLSGIATKKSLAIHNIDIDDIDGVLVTHEHIDHSKGLGVLARKYKKKIYITKKTYSALPGSVGIIPEDNLKFIVKPEFSIGSLKISAFSTSHDAIDPKGYRISGEKDILVATDTGIITEELKSAACGCDFAFIESNHDVFMLTHGIYPVELQRRILSDFGHLPNKETAQFAVWLASKGTKKFMLGHLSGENNTEDLARKETENALNIAGFCEAAQNLRVASRYFPSELFEL